MYDFRAAWRRALPATTLLLILSCPPPSPGARAGEAPARDSLSSGAEQVDAEVLLDEYDVQDRVVAQGFERSIAEHRIIRVLTAAGAASQGTMSIPYAEGTKLEELVVICTSPDGRKTHVQPERMLDRVRLQLGGDQLRERTFPLPGIVPGSKIEYRLLETISEPDHLMPLWLTCQRDIPVREIRLNMRAWPQSPFILRTNAGHGESSPVTRDASGRLHMTIRNVPAFRSEALMPPEIESRLSIYGTYVSDEQRGEPWKMEADGSDYHRKYGAMRSYTDSAATIARRLTQGITDPESRARRLYQFCHDELRNAESGPDSGLVIPVRIMHPDETLLAVFRQRVASPDGVNLAFAALAEAAGLDIHLAWGIAPGHAAFDSSFATFRGFSFVVVMIKNDHGWWYCCPGDYWQAFGVMSPEYEGSPAVFTGGPRAVLGRLPHRPAEESAVEREWELELDADGRLAGVIRLRATGHVAARYRERLNRIEGVTKTQELLGELLERYPTAEVDPIAADDSVASEAPFAASFHVRIPDFAQRAGGSLLVPAVPVDMDPMPGLRDGARTHAICLPFVWSENERVRIRLPKGSVAGAASKRLDTKFAGLGNGEVELLAGPDQQFVGYSRRLTFGSEGVVRLSPDRYPELQGSLDALRDIGRTRIPVRPAPPREH